MDSATRTEDSNSPSTEVSALLHQDKDVRQSAAMALGEKANPDQADALADALFEEPDFFVRETLSWALMRIGEAALPSVLGRLSGNHSAQARTQALHVLSKIGSPRAVDAILPLTADADAGVAEKARWALGRIGDARALPTLVDLMGDGSAEQYNSLTIVLSSFGTDVVRPMVDALSDENPQVRRQAADVLCYVGDPQARPAMEPLAAATKDDDDDVAVAALVAVGELDTPRAHEVIAQASTSENRRVSNLAQRLSDLIEL